MFRAFTPLVWKLFMEGVGQHNLSDRPLGGRGGAGLVGACFDTRPVTAPLEI